ncbi:Lysophospholipase L1 [Moraxella cuniculi DSM 21768]|uniref:Lysophospholipase L1 n=1 Tax=Moraxella cuniculi DSM 21768 TaxID=1122245 RepID=A0A1N7EDJ0_9GAMM|nr:SGNH/GDSL hydrolase family protein [Moraxella cuniculi]OOS05326.1 hypothetical protein B0189_06865 [Moraxella cuniculi]SIR86161.1 Lysophospholipase L1 [Moraxella cuniculi DSM 21768]
MKFNTLDWLLAPIYLYQATKVKQNAISLPEPCGDRSGCRQLGGDCGTFRLMIVGDSAAAGVGSTHQDTAASGRIIHHVSAHLYDTCTHLDWQLHATTGHTSGQILARLYTLPTQAIDTVVISVGVNDVVKRTSDTIWQHNIRAMIAVLVRKFAAKQVIFLSLPPMSLMPSLPAPLCHLLARQARRLDRLLQAVCKHDDTGVALYLSDEFAKHRLDPKAMFANDGFHPSVKTYDIWAMTISHAIKERFVHICHQNTISTRPNTAV